MGASILDPAAAVGERARSDPESAAIHWGASVWCYEELWGRIDARGRHLVAAGLEAGELVSVAFRHGPDYVVDLLAVWWAGGAVAPLHPRGTATEEQHAEQLFRPRFHINPSGLVVPGRQAKHALRFAPEDGVGVCIATSGSSGLPRGIVLTHSGFMTSATAAQRRLGLVAGDRWGLVLSVAHVGGMSTVIRAMYLGAALHLSSGFDAPALAHSILDGRVTHVSLVPSMLASLIDHGVVSPPKTFGCALVGGAHTPPGLLQRAAEAQIPIALTWGMTETTAQITTAPPELVLRVPGTVGAALDFLEVHADDSGRLGVRGPTLAHRIIEGPGADPVPLPLDDGGWFRTQDRGRIDPEGLVWVEGRVDAVIVSGGVNVDPREVEGVLSEASGVREVAVFGRPDEKWGQIIAAAVVMRVGDTSTASDLHRHCRGRLTRGKCPSHIVIVPELPRTPSGKLAYGRLADFLESN